MFSKIELRTTDVDAARAFYTEVTGRATEPVALPDRARTAGAPAHWLGHIGVDDVDGTARRLVELGGQPLGPPRARSEEVALLRDPLGAVLALCTRSHAPADDRFAWHELHTTDCARAWSTYAELFGWASTGSLDLGARVGPYHTFAWRPGGPSVGGMADTARLPGIHTHWLHYLRVADIDAAVASVRALGGTVMNGPQPFRDGDRVAQCEDPQGAAFALYQRV